KKDDLAKFGTRIREEGQSLLNMINDIMFLSRIESGVKNTKESVNLKNLAMGIVDNLKDKALRSDVTLALDCPDNLEVYFVRRYMSEILNNLIDNAIKYNREHGKVYILIKKDSKNIEIRVSDTGIGIPDDDIERIFERFFCVDRSHSSRDSTGLGLTIVKHIVEECSGTIEVKSKLGEGTTFCISIPDDSSAPAQLPPK
ncbi:MAG: sensor histidine kinase, partial [Succinivibrio sp.]